MLIWKKEVALGNVEGSFWHQMLSFHAVTVHKKENNK